MSGAHRIHWCFGCECVCVCKLKYVQCYGLLVQSKISQLWKPTNKRNAIQCTLLPATPPKNRMPSESSSIQFYSNIQQTAVSIPHISFHSTPFRLVIILEMQASHPTRKLCSFFNWFMVMWIIEHMNETTKRKKLGTNKKYWQLSTKGRFDVGSDGARIWFVLCFCSIDSTNIFDLP